jgi:hypothetical protein
MKPDQNNTSIDIDKLTLLNVKVFKAHLEANETFRDAPQTIHEYSVETATDSAFNFKDKLCRFRLFLKVSALDPEKNQLGLDAEYGIEFHFHIENLNDYLIHQEGNEVRVNSNLGTCLCGISYSTARGIILERMQGTYFHGVILPIVDASKLLQKETEATLK